MKYITSIWFTFIIVACLIGLRVNDSNIIQELRLTVFDQYIKSIPLKESKNINMENFQCLGIMIMGNM